MQNSHLVLEDKMKAKIINEETKEVSVAFGSNPPKDYVEMDVEHAYNGYWYVKGYAPKKPDPTKEEVSETRRQLYIAEKDPITCQIQALRDEEQTEEIIAQIESLKEERARVVEKIKAENPYPKEAEAQNETGNI